MIFVCEHVFTISAFVIIKIIMKIRINEITSFHHRHPHYHCHHYHKPHPSPLPLSHHHPHHPNNHNINHHHNLYHHNQILHHEHNHPCRRHHHFPHHNHRYKIIVNLSCRLNILKSGLNEVLFLIKLCELLCINIKITTICIFQKKVFIQKKTNKNHFLLLSFLSEWICTLLLLWKGGMTS